MTTLLAAFGIVALLLLAVSALLALTTRLQDRRDLARDRQIALTDAIHWELGAVAAPTVRRGRGGRWQVSMMLPLDRPAMVAGVLGVASRHFGAMPGSERVEFVLTPDTSNLWPRPAECSAPRRLTTGRPLAA